ncbi:hypothetical protein RI129_010141 [Pyrocoelia pectoralis]|uniref:Carboxylic ester hydrolase n=1 Tax=Pyrocoelia pectoralis TaxID=417401 RepID=A0AAN7VCW9_9COLE
MLLVFYYTYSVELISGHINNANPKVTTPLGDIEGSFMQSLLGKSIYAFRGIRYAKAPVGELRFQPPVPVENWSGVYNATNDGPMCPQPFLRPISEDCLYLNIYTTKLSSSRYNPKRPVLFFIHPGGFFLMSSASNWFGPQYLLDRNIVLVTINYRLGSLGKYLNRLPYILYRRVGFMSTGDKWAPGNNGLKDQVIALKFVKHNIASFGGDPNLVTIVGYSAGGISVATHLVSPMSTGNLERVEQENKCSPLGLFHRAIGMSCSSFNQWPMGNHQFNLAQKQARLVGCSDDTSENIIRCLKTKSAEEIGDSLGGFKVNNDRRRLIAADSSRPSHRRVISSPSHLSAGQLIADFIFDNFSTFLPILFYLLV